MARPKKQQPKRRDGTYEVKVIIGHTFDGKPIRKSFYSAKSPQDAKARAQEYLIEQEVTARTGVVTSASEMTISEWAESWLEIYKKPNVSTNSFEYTYANAVRNHIIPYFKNSRLIDIKPLDIQRFYSKKSTVLSESMMHKIDLCINGIFETAIDNDLIVKNPAKHIKYTSSVPPIKKQVYSEEQLTAAKNYLKNDDFPAAYVILESGLRKGEFLGLMWSDFDYQNKTLSVNRSIARSKTNGVEIRPPKWGSYRTIPISTELADFIESQPRKGLYIFGDNGSIRTVDSFNKRFSTSMTHLINAVEDMPKLTAHELRHTYGTHLRRIGVDIYTIQKIMGHKDINITANTYVHEETETTRKAAKIV